MNQVATLDVPFAVATHNGTITLKSHKSGDHRTIRIHTQAADAKFAPGERLAELLVGQDNTSDYKAFAFVKPDGSVYLFKKHSNSEFYLWLARFLRHPERFLDKVSINFEGACRRCNRALTTPDSAEAGIGPVCAGLEE